MGDAELVCWKCGASVSDETLPFARTAECRACRAELHVCRMCEFYDTTFAGACREPVAEPPSDKERANFCGYFRPRPGAFSPAGEEAARARAELDALFGGAAAPGAPEPTGPDPDGESDARRQLDRLFGGSDG
ncbi:MAG: hypothetical protein P8080_04055 [Gammaproteobacteria bacterium]